MSLDGALRCLKQTCDAAHLGPELRRRTAYKSPAERRRRKRRAAIHRLATATRREQRDA